MRSLLPFTLALTLSAGPALAAPAKPAAPAPKPSAPAAKPTAKPTAKPAAPAPVGERLTLDQALRAAKAQQPQLRQAAADVAAAEARTEQSRAALLPSLSLSTGYQFGPARQNINQTAPVTNLGSYSLNANADQILYDFGQTNNRYQASLASAAAQGQTARQTGVTVAANVRTAFFTARANQTLVQVAQETLANQQRHLSQTQALVEIGTRPPIDMAQTAKDVANARLSLINAQNAYQTAKAQLNQAMGVERDTAYTIADEAAGPVPGEDAGLEPLLKEALANRPDLAALQERIQAQTLTLEAAEHASYPSLRASAGAGANGTPQVGPNGNWNAGVGLSWPFYSGGAREAQAKEAKAALASLTAQGDSLRQQVRLAVEQARLAVVSAKAAVQAAAESTRSARVQLNLAEGRYAAGVGSVIELGDAQLAYTNARAQEVQEGYKLATARAQLLQALGRE